MTCPVVVSSLSPSSNRASPKSLILRVGRGEWGGVSEELGVRPLFISLRVTYEVPRAFG